jgi:hypothetical protein
VYVVAAAALVLACGCGDPTGRPAGKVTLGGQPVVGAELRFEPSANKDAPVTGLSGEGGVYVLDFGKKGGVPVGPCVVTITYYTLPNGKPLPGGEQGSALRSDPEKVARHEYVFEKEVVKGDSAMDFELSVGRKTGGP